MVKNQPNRTTDTSEISHARPVAVGENSLSDLLSSGQIVFAIWEDFRLDDGNESVLLADGCIASEHLSNLDQSAVRWSCSRDFVDATPFCELGSIL